VSRLLRKFNWRAVSLSWRSKPPSTPT